MDLEDEYRAAQEDESMVSASDPQRNIRDPVTYDPTQGRGTDAWQEAKRRQAELNARLGANARFRRN